ncbi:MAG: PhzF family phenazine biosynthesis protein [Acidimicrobiales bacterium]|nr:PhzF family phenazine biosynthesis protein [Acidimicrobiales bacterium]
MGTFVTVVDAFSDRPFRGNPAAVCILDGPVDDDWMQKVAAEMNLSTTAFCHLDGALWDLRWFTPLVEIDLCGHATLATAHVLASDHSVEGTIRFTTRSGLLAAQSLPDGIVLDFPADPTRKIDAPQGLLAALGIADDTPVRKGRTHHLVALDDEAAVRAVRPTFSLLRRVECRGVIVTAPADADADHDVVSRVFAPAIGIDEDSATGSAHCALGAYWSARLERDRLRYHQASARGGELEVTRVGDRVEILGQAVITMRGELVS